MKLSYQLAAVLRQAAKEVNTWKDWQRSIDPQGNNSQPKPQKSSQHTAKAK